MSSIGARTLIGATTIVCDICPRGCHIALGQTGSCHVRKNEGGKNISSNYGAVTSVALDPIEKKPIKCWKPGSTVLSLGSFGCNLNCPFCQNSSISQVGGDQVAVSWVTPEGVVAKAAQLACDSCVGIAYTYNEPLVGFEFIRDTGCMAHEAGLSNVVVTNGAISAWVLAEVLPYIDAINIDLKGFSDRYYRACGNDAFSAVKRTIESCVACDTCHVEVTSLIVPGLVDFEEMDRAVEWLASLDDSIPYHVSQYHPAYRMKTHPLPDERVKQFAAQAQTRLENVFIGNMVCTPDQFE